MTFKSCTFIETEYSVQKVNSRQLLIAETTIIFQNQSRILFWLSSKNICGETYNYCGLRSCLSLGILKSLWLANVV
jgi:hypothetical protein